MHAFTGLLAADSRFGQNGHATVTTSSGRLCSSSVLAAVVQEDVALDGFQRKFKG